MGVKVTNNAYGTLSASITTSGTTITLDSGQGARFPTLGAGDYFYGTLVDTSNNIEVVKVTARSTDSMTVVRGQDNTTATAFAIGDRFELRPTAALFESIIDEVEIPGITSNSTSGTAITIGSSNDTTVENDLIVDGDVGIGATSPENPLHVVDTRNYLYSTTADKNTNMAGVRVTNSNNNDNWAGVWFATGGISGTHWSGIAGARTSNATTWGTHLAFFTHEDSTNNLTQSTERMRIDSAGRVTMPYQPVCNITNSTNQSVSFTNGAKFDCNLNNFLLNRGGFSVSSNVVTVPASGVYRLRLKTESMIPSGNTWNIRAIAIRPKINGTTLFDSAGDDNWHHCVPTHSNSHYTITNEHIKSLSASDTVGMEVQIYHNAGTPTTGFWHKLYIEFLG